MAAGVAGNHHTMASGHCPTLSAPITTPPPRVVIAHHHGVIRIILLDETLSLDQIGTLQSALESILNHVPHPRVVLDLRCCRYMPTTAIGVFVSMHGHVIRDHGALHIVTGASSIHELFVITRLDRLFALHETVEDALGAFDGP